MYELASVVEWPLLSIPRQIDKDALDLQLTCPFFYSQRAVAVYQFRPQATPAFMLHASHFVLS